MISWAPWPLATLPKARTAELLRDCMLAQHNTVIQPIYFEARMRVHANSWCNAQLSAVHRARLSRTRKRRTFWLWASGWKTEMTQLEEYFHVPQEVREHQQPSRSTIAIWLMMDTFACSVVPSHRSCRLLRFLNITVSVFKFFLGVHQLTPESPSRR